MEKVQLKKNLRGKTPKVPSWEDFFFTKRLILPFGGNRITLNCGTIFSLLCPLWHGKPYMNYRQYVWRILLHWRRHTILPKLLLFDSSWNFPILKKKSFLLDNGEIFFHIFTCKTLISSRDFFAINL